MRNIRSTEFPFRTVLLTCVAAGLACSAAVGQGRRARPITALKVGTIHTVAQGEIENGVILYRSGRILAVGPADKVKIPEGATTLDYPKAHAYPGLVDALSDAYAPAKDLANSSVNAGTDFADALDRDNEAAQDLIRYGITTAFVRNRSTATWRGLGAIVKPTGSGFTTLRRKRHGGVSLRMTTGDRAGHALDRLKKFDKTGNVFDSLDSYEKKQKDYAEALKKYEKEYEAYLAHFAKKKPRGKAQPGKKPNVDPKAAKKEGAKPAKSAPAKASAKKPEGETPTRRTNGSGRTRRAGSRTGARTSGRRQGGARSAPGGTPRAASSGASKGKSKSDAPKKPKYPKKVAKDPAKEALLKVLDGKLPLRIEAHRTDEIRAALFMAMLKELPGVTLEIASDAGAIAKEIAEAGAPVVVTNLLSDARDIDSGRDRSALPAQLHAAGVSVAIGSGSVAQARNLTLMAAYACGRGLPEDAAVRALTLTPAKILGISDTVGSLERRKAADILITSGPLLRSDTRILRVIAQGVSQFEAK